MNSIQMMLSNNIRSAHEAILQHAQNYIFTVSTVCFNKIKHFPEPPDETLDRIFQSVLSKIYFLQWNLHCWYEFYNTKEKSFLHLTVWRKCFSHFPYPGTQKFKSTN